jgi:hypothetical protein
MKKLEINRIIKKAKKLSKTKTEEELFEIIGKETIPFKDKFKLGDIICSDRFHNGLCMVVDYLKEDYFSGEYRYSCDDLVKEHQRWGAYEFHTYEKYHYNWRIATDNDIAKYLSRFLDIPLGKVGQFYVAKLTDDGIMLEDLMFTDRDVHLVTDELADLKRIIDERVG